ncbi:hypothetical protein MKX01_031010, partial [Papaver californicum]
RRISASKGYEDPTCIEIGDCWGALKLPYAIEISKAYPHDFMQVGRVRVHLKREDGTLCNPDIKSTTPALDHCCRERYDASSFSHGSKAPREKQKTGGSVVKFSISRNFF